MEMALAWLIAFVIGIGVPIAIVRLLRAPLERVLNELFAMQWVTDFYVRSFRLLVIMVGAGFVLGRPFIRGMDPKHPEPAHFMQYVWAVADNVNPVVREIRNYLLLFVLILAILVALGEKRHWITKRT